MEESKRKRTAGIWGSQRGWNKAQLPRSEGKTGKLLFVRYRIYHLVIWSTRQRLLSRKGRHGLVAASFSLSLPLSLSLFHPLPPSFLPSLSGAREGGVLPLRFHGLYVQGV